MSGAGRRTEAGTKNRRDHADKISAPLSNWKDMNNSEITTMVIFLALLNPYLCQADLQA